MRKTSVIIPFYNNDDYIEECINSVLQQTCQPKEIIVVNDGSSSKSRQFLAQLSDKVTIIDHDVNLGIAQARNTGAKNSTGEYLAFLDADDIWQAEKNQQQEHLLINNPELAGCHTGVNIFSQDMNIIETCLNKPKILDLKNSAIESHVVPSSFMIRRSIFLKVGGFDPKVRVEDYDLFLTLITNHYLIQFIPEALTWLRRDNHGNESAKWQFIFYGRNDILKKHGYTLYKHNGLLSLLNFLQRTCELSRWRAKGPINVIFMILSFILPKARSNE
ncbi:glycosyltransferase family 2 protein [Colwellia sp. M166]|uniref:glycosyltransferase family 2 protein n=1 Tax=Colwellia sp. M166 TaxID=2583805 RepID=UPI00211EDF3B|nr:glycosyltransferase family A protein [Colwellia sp. M166]UUO23427.1 glycosyltransferase family 2 protein [Colwellia sp. M166]|tara:strand:+ start:2239 stop:3063 length:825 start_codon:yes stop_codon:yes gene_type:complete